MIQVSLSFLSSLLISDFIKYLFFVPQYQHVKPQDDFTVKKTVKSTEQSGQKNGSSRQRRTYRSHLPCSLTSMVTMTRVLELWSKPIMLSPNKSLNWPAKLPPCFPFRPLLPPNQWSGVECEQQPFLLRHHASPIVEILNHFVASLIAAEVSC